MTSVLLIYPFFQPRFDRSVFRFPPLGITYLAASLIRDGHDVRLVDCTFLSRKEAFARVNAARAEIVGIYCMVAMLEDCLALARALKAPGRLLVAGGPLPTCAPELFLEDFDLAAIGEGEETIREIASAHAAGKGYSQIAGLAMRTAAIDPGGPPAITRTPPRAFETELDRLPFPARHLLPNGDYIRSGRRRYGFSVTTVMSSRGCPYRCEFCSNVVFGGSYRERSAENVLAEIEEALALGYDRISFADDVFTLSKRRLLAICGLIRERGLRFQWECLGRVDSIDADIAAEMASAGCRRIYFGIESGNDRILALMGKQITTARARQAVVAARNAGLDVGAFFILFYPGDTAETVKDTLRFATRLPVNYLGLTHPYVLPGTRLERRLNSETSGRGAHPIIDMRIYGAGFSPIKKKTVILAGRMIHRLRLISSPAGKAAAGILESLVEFWISR